MNSKIKFLICLLIIFILGVDVHKINAQDGCEFGYIGGICQDTVISSGQNTHRDVGYSLVVDHYEEEWGSLAQIMAAGYWNPVEGQQGISFSGLKCRRYITEGSHTLCEVSNVSNDTACDWGSGTLDGFNVTYHNGTWVYKIEWHDVPITAKYICLGHGGLWWDRDWDGEKECTEKTYPYNEIYDTLSLYEILAKSSIPCEYYKTTEARWFDSWDEYQLIPFEDIIIEPWEKIEVITHFWGASLQIPFPCASVTRSPYPRALTGEEAYFTVEPVIVTAASEPIDTCTPDISQYQVHIRLVPDEDFQPIWYWDERNFSSEPSISEGWSVAHTWQTASYSLDGACSDLSCDKPLWGPSLSGEWLPAHKVNVTIAYDLQVKRTWIDWYGHEQGTGWESVDLREYGYNTSNLVLTGARDVTAPPAGAMAPYPLDLCLVPVPVIEAQSLLSGN